MAGSDIDYLSFAYAFIVMIGGAIGYAKAGSLTSMVMGFAFGFILAVGAKQTSLNPKNIWISIVAASILAVVMGLRFMKSQKFMPAGLVASLSFFAVIRHIYRYLNV